ncbi:hypothetical protein F5050DRAFT_1574314 [Lentinula boryana]|uniref:Uncharacterized protein n=1 Tax=Lentinula boryana TaxID=40481 RepID=A0ABQ8Q967_9AGAR|nr:hypothetical protein F5050DRAFT_1574314 [Lentinula boryana]
MVNKRYGELYPDIPLEFPFGTGNETFSLSPGYKEAATLAWSLTTDIEFSSRRRFWTQIAANASVKAYGFYFIQETVSTAPELEGKLHSCIV